ncbi:MAG: triose-phosphate isomerase [Chitinophagales bacterium]|jgi:triosephosphate isomerase|nr:triose-phosphate isomerase [Saprospirales bacterium]MBP6659139.1 triose-phosphate isomerase [Chitinophagales bacterium]
MRKKIIAGNWKMNATKDEAVTIVNGLIANYSDYGLSENKIVVVASPFPYIHYCASMFAKFPNLVAAAQNCSEFEKGAYTGEVSAEIIASLYVEYVIIGHSERRQYFKETDEQLLLKINQAQNHNLIPIFCVGETLETRDNNKHFEFVKEQLENAIFKVNENDIKNCVIAYEPIWAIGTGVTASPAQAQEMHAFIREQVSAKFNGETAKEMSILYGGSVNAANAAELFTCADIDGALVGGASLKVDDFSTIIKAMK